MEGERIRKRLEGRELKYFSLFSLLLLAVIGIVGMVEGGQGPGEVLRGLWIIVVSRDALITDYFELAGYGAALANAVLVMAMGLYLLYREKVKFTDRKSVV